MDCPYCNAIMRLPGEEFRFVPFEGFENVLVSNNGRVIYHKPSPERYMCRLANKKKDDKNYALIFVKTGDRKIGMGIHRMVLAAFVGPCPPGHNVNHKDRVKSNNNLSNLEYCTHSENIKHNYKTYNEYKAKLATIAKENAKLTIENTRLRSILLNVERMAKKAREG